MRKIAICLTNDLLYDRRIQRIVQSLSKNNQVSVLHRKLHDSSEEGIKCIWNKGALFYLEFNIRIFFRLLKNQYDCIVAVDYDTLLACGLASRIVSVPLIFDAHELFEESIEIAHRPFVKGVWKFVGKSFIPRVTKAYTVSASIANYYHGKFGIEFDLVRNLPYAIEKELSPLTMEKKVILYQGVLNEGRKLEMLIDCVSLLPAEFEIWIIGEGDLSEELRTKNTQRVIFHSWVKAEELPSYTSQAFLAYNLLDGSSQSYYYSLANKFFDYIQCGVPSLNPAFPEYLTYNERYNCCYIEDVHHAKNLAEWILKISADKKTWQEKRKNALLAAEELNWEREQRKLQKIYDFDSNTSL